MTPGVAADEPRSMVLLPTPTVPVPDLPRDVDTPALLVDLGVMERNIGRMAAAMAERGVRLRPHAKTHKSVAIARLQLEAGAQGITVGTLGEAEVMAEGGIDDLFIAYPLWPSGSKASRLRELAGRVRLSVGLDSPAGAAALAAAVKGTAAPLAVVIEIDCGGHRTGVPPAEAAPLAETAREAGLAVRGVFSHGGHGYAGRAERVAAAADEVEALGAAAAALRERGFEPAVVSAGSTPTATLSATGAVNEERPGTYVFGDRQQLALGACGPEEIGLFVLSTVVSSPGRGRFVVDAGAKTLAADRPAFLAGHGLAPALPEAIISRTYDYHAVVELPAGIPAPAVGSVLAIVPNHVCPVVNLADELLVVRDGRLLDRWPVDARGRTA
jgi:D-serine deaminase-like pyridoxal phosphate-dependent protein